MKTTTPSLKSFQPILAAALAIVIVSGLSVRPAQAGYIVTLKEVGSNVVATGSGAIDLTALTFVNTSTASLAFIFPSLAQIITGPTSGTADVYSGVISGPTSFGSGGFIFASSGSGDAVGKVEGFGAEDFLILPQAYVSGNALSDSSTYNNATFASLGVTPGTYEWTWGTGANQNFTLNVTAVPDSGSTISLVVMALTCLFGVSRFRSFRLA
jgi:VPDSG-CTERM motif